MSSDDFPLLAITIACAGVIGLFVGSFLNVVIYRVPRGLSVSVPRSFCPACLRQLTWWENIPLASWAALRGRCRTCGNPIAIRYPLVEVSTAVVFALLAWTWHGSPVTAGGYCCLAAAMIAVALIEYGGIRSPLSVAAVGTGIAQVLILIGAGWDQDWRLLSGSIVGTSTAFLVLSALRVTDPDCVDPRGHGRTALLMTGCWVGGLGITSIAVAASVWIATFFLAMATAWATSRHKLVASSTARVQAPIPPVFSVPLVSALVLAMAASLAVRGR
jgi:leader peptidase (prepilin peptidase) / N-methyltransferase